MHNQTKARQSWGNDLPQWVAELAERCDAYSQGDVARGCGYSNTAINQVLSRKYPGSYSNVQSAAEAYLQAKTVTCPVLGDIPTPQCHRQQRQPFNNCNHQLVRLYRACHGGCVHAQTATPSKDRQP